jgi:hypothetical protein
LTGWLWIDRFVLIDAVRIHHHISDNGRMLHSEFAHGVADDSIYHACTYIRTGSIIFCLTCSFREEERESGVSLLGIENSSPHNRVPIPNSPTASL